MEVNVNGINVSNFAIINKQLETMFQKNPQIRSLIYTKPLLGDFTQVISKSLPNLEEFSIPAIDSGIHLVHFDQVRHFALSLNSPGPCEKLSFQRLESLAMRYTQKNHDGSARNSWIQFFRNHQNIKELNCIYLDNEGLVELLAELPHLDEIRISSTENFNIDLISGIIESHTNLLKFQTIVHQQTDEVDLEIYQEKFGNEWHINHSIVSQWSTIKFEREN